MAAPVNRLVFAQPIRGGRGAEHLEWCRELRARRDELGASRRRAGIRRQITWSHPPSDLAIVRVDADDPVAAVRSLDASDDPFDRWYAARERDLHGASLLSDGVVPEVLADYVNGEPDELDMFIAVGVRLRPGRIDSFRDALATSMATGSGVERIQQWDVRRLTIWLHRTPRGDVAIYEAVGDLEAMLASLAESDHPQIVAQRAAVLDRFGIDLTRESWPIPQPGVSWSAE